MANLIRWLSYVYILLLIPAYASSDTATNVISNLNTLQLQALLLSDPNTIVIDVRSKEEVLLNGGMIDAPRIYNIPRGVLEFGIGEIAESFDQPIVVYSATNLRSPLAANTLMKMGYSQVHNYKDSFKAWQQAGLPIELLDKALDSILFSKPIKVSENVWSAIGATEPASYENSGHNNNLSFIVTKDGVVVINAGDNYRLAEALHFEIKAITQQPVKMVILENGQGHAAGGSAYWKELGVPIIAHEDAAAVWLAGGENIVERIKRRMRDNAFGTVHVLPDETFTGNKIIEMGGVRIELLTLGPAHSPGDISVWLPAEKVLIAGDIAFHQRLLPIFEHTDTKSWLETWEVLEALQAEHVIPGHGEATNMNEVRTYTKGYLTYMREQIQALLDDGAFLEDVANIDQSAYRHLDTFDELYRLNASRMFRIMEFEF